jgi:hypothetical protein
MATTRIPPTTPPSGNSSAVGREATLDKSKYQVENLQYPIDLFGGGGGSSGSANGNQFFNQTYLNYVVFYINVSEQSRVFTDNKVGIVGDVDKSDQNTVQGKNASIGSATATAAAAGGLVGGVLGAGQGLASGASNNVQNLRGGAGGAARFVAGTLGSGAAGGIKGAVAGAAASGAAVAYGKLLEAGNPGLKATKSMKRLKSAIALHVPNEVTVGYRAQYGEEELGAIFGAAAEAGTNGGGGDFTKSAAVAKGMELNPARNMLSALYKAVPNPRKEQLFKSMEFRRFTMNYQFAPRSPKEAENVKRIINTFKFYMHPEFQNNVNKMLYLFPSEFDIVYYFGDKEHPHLNKISTCVLTDMQVNYSPNGQFATHVDGFPTQINVNMTFLELETLTKERFLGQSPNGQTGSGDYNFENPRLPTF